MSDGYLYLAQEKQARFHYSEADEVFYGGAAGGGKSEAILFDAVQFCLENKNVKTSIFRRTFPELEKSIILRFLEKAPRDKYKYNKQEHRVYWDSGSILEFNHCQYESDVFKFQSAEYDRMYFDELTHFTEFIYRYLRSRVRTTKKHIKAQIKSASNPGNIGHLWVKKTFIDGVTPNQLCVKKEEESGAEFTVEFIPAKVYDNKYLMEADPGYVKKLMRLPEDERKALLDGDWNVFKGQFFKEWLTNVHVVKPFKIPSGWKVFRALDWGWRKPFCVVWLAIDHDGSICVFKELYDVEKTDEQVVKLIKKMTGSQEIAYTIADPSIWSVTQYEKGESLAHRFNKMGIPMIKGDNNRLSGANIFHSYLYHSKKEKPKLTFFSNCYDSIRTIPALIHDLKKPEDVDTLGEDHAYDAIRYGLMAHPIPTPQEKKKQVKNVFQKHMDQKKARRHEGIYVGGV